MAWWPRVETADRVTHAAGKLRRRTVHFAVDIAVDIAVDNFVDKLGVCRQVASGWKRVAAPDSGPDMQAGRMTATVSRETLAVSLFSSCMESG